jgi:6-phosphofructokinase 1
MPRNVLIAQSGGPSAVINNTLRGIIDGCRGYPADFGRIYGAWYGIEGVLQEDLLDLSEQDDREIALLEVTPAAGAIGTCRYKLRADFQEDFARIIEVLAAHNIGYFFYIGGNDSMDTAYRVSAFARARGVDLVAVGGPKTIDNDVGDADFKLVDHTPGYGSTARYLAHIVANANEENAGSCTSDPVLVIQAMGRRIGFIPAAARLADPERQMPLRIFLPEARWRLDEVGEVVCECLRAHRRCIAVVSEGLELADLGAVKDAFGHTEFGATRLSVAQVLTQHLNDRGLPVRGHARYQIPGTDQRTAAIYASTVDREEAYAVAGKCVEIALREGTGWMATILRAPGECYQPLFDKVPLDVVANSQRAFPKAWIGADRYDVTDEFIRYARPLIGDAWSAAPLEDGLPRYARFRHVFAEQRCRAYVPEAHRAQEPRGDEAG